MNIKNLMLLLPLVAITASCSDSDLDGTRDGTNPYATRSELQVTIKGQGETQEYDRTTRAIASENENEIQTLEVYLFAAAVEGGPYYYLEKWTEGKSYNPDAPTNDFKLQDAGADKKASLYPNELKGLPYIKLLCVANNKATSTAVVDGKFYEEDGATELLPTLTPVEVDKDENITNAAAATTVEAFQKTFTKDIDKAIIPTPLLMTGQGQTKISGSVSVVTIELRRVVARFDIDNNTSTSQLTIKTITMAQGRKTGALWGANLTKEADLAANPLVYLADYQPVDFTDIPDANKGLAQSALYVYPTLATDESYLIIEGEYKSPVTSEQVPVTYHVPIVNTPAGTNKGEYIPIKANSRYKLRITDVTQSNVFGTFDVEDWTSGGGIVIKPNNDAPVFAGIDAFVDGDIPIALTDAEGKVYGYEVKTDAATGNGTVAVQIASTGHVRAEKGPVTKADDTGWLDIKAQSSEEKDGVWYTLFVMTYTDAIGKQPVAVTFINDAASYDPALWTTINFYGPKAVPSFALVDKGNSTGNLTALTDNDAKKPTASIYNAKGSFVQFDITSIEGIEVNATEGGYKIEKVKTTDFVHTYKITVDDPTAVASTTTLSFKNAGDPTKATDLVITSEDPSLKFSMVKDDDSVGDWEVGTETPYPTTGKLKIDLDALKEYTFKIDAPEGFEVTNLNDCKWLNITPTDHTWQDADGERYVEYKITPNTNAPDEKPDCVLNFINKLETPDVKAPGLAITVHKDFSKPKLSAGTTTNWSDFNQGFAAAAKYDDPTNASISMYKVAGSKITVTMTCGEAASFEAATGLTIQQVNDTDEYEISIADADNASKITGDQTVVTAHNDGAVTADGNNTDRKATLTINWVSPEITFGFFNDTLDGILDGGGKAEIAGDNINVTYDTLGNRATISIEITGYPGSEITYTDNTNTWLNQQTEPTEIGVDGTVTVEFQKNGAGNQSETKDIIITVKNGITDGGNKTITLHKQ